MALPSISSAYPQTSPTEVKEKIKEIKLDERFLFGEGFSEDSEMSDREALKELSIMVNTLRQENKCNGGIELDELKKIASRVECVDEGIYEVCYYIPIETALGKTVETPVISSVSKPEEPEKTPPVVSNPVPDNVNVYVVPSEDLDDMIEAILAQDTWYEIRTILSHHKGLGRLKDSGRDTSLTNVPSDANILLFDDQGGMTGFLSPKNEHGQRTNYKTRALESDSQINDYKFLFWYK